MEIQTLEWWNNFRHSLNKAHLISGSVVVICTSVIYCSITSLSLKIVSIFMLGIFVYMIYLGTINIFALLFEFIDRQYFDRHKSSKIKQAAGYYLWTTIIVP